MTQPFNPQADRDARLYDQLEAILDDTNVEWILEALTSIAGEKAAHVRTNWQDAKLGDEWGHVSKVLRHFLEEWTLHETQVYIETGERG